MVFWLSTSFLCQASPDANKLQTEAIKPRLETNARESSPAKDSQIATPVAREDVKEGPESDEGLPVYPYDRLRTSSTNPAPDIDVTKREVNLLWHRCLTVLCSNNITLAYCRGICLWQSSKTDLGWQRRLLRSYQSGSRIGSRLPFSYSEICYRSGCFLCLVKEQWHDWFSKVNFFPVIGTSGPLAVNAAAVVRVIVRVAYHGQGTPGRFLRGRFSEFLAAHAPEMCLLTDNFSCCATTRVGLLH